MQRDITQTKGAKLYLEYAFREQKYLVTFKGIESIENIIVKITRKLLLVI